MGNSQETEHKLSLIDYIKAHIKFQEIDREIVNNSQCEKYGIVITKSVWYSCKLFVRYTFELNTHNTLANLNTNNKWVNLPGVMISAFKFDNNPQIQIFNYNKELGNTQHISKEGAISQMQNYKTEISAGTYNINSKYSPYNNYTKYKDLPILSEQIVHLFTECFQAVNVIPPKYKISESEGKMLKIRGLYEGALDELVGRVQELYFRMEEIEFWIEFGEIFQIISHTYEEERDRDGQNYNSQRIVHTYNTHYTAISLCTRSKVTMNKIILISKNYTDENIIQFPWMEHIINRNLSDFISFEVYYKHFCIKLPEINNTNLREEFGIEQAIQTIPTGSILRIYRNKTIYTYWHAGVYLGADLIANVNIDTTVQGDIFTFIHLDDFIGDSTKLEIIVLLYQPFTVHEIKEKAVLMNGKEWAYDLSENNCEHLAFQCAVGISGSPQMLNLWKKCVAKVTQGIKDNFMFGEDGHFSTMVPVGHIEELNKSTLTKFLGSPAFYHIIFFYSSKCKKCEALSPTFQKLFEDYEEGGVEYRTDIAFGRMNGGVNKETGERYGIMEYPTILLFKGEPPEPVDRYEGDGELQNLIEWINQAAPIAATMDITTGEEGIFKDEEINNLIGGSELEGEQPTPCLSDLQLQEACLSVLFRLLEDRIRIDQLHSLIDLVLMTPPTPQTQTQEESEIDLGLLYLFIAGVGFGLFITIIWKCINKTPQSKFNEL